MDDLTPREAELVKKLEETEKRLLSVRTSLLICCLAIMIYLWKDELVAVLVELGANVDA